MNELPRKKAPSMRVTIGEKWELSNPLPPVKSAVIFRYSDGTIILSVVRDFSKGDQGSVKGCKTVSSAKMLFARLYHPSKEDKAEWEKIK